MRLDPGSSLTARVFKTLWNSKTGGLGVKRVLLHEGNSPKVADRKRDGEVGQINCVNIFTRNKYLFFNLAKDGTSQNQKLEFNSGRQNSIQKESTGFSL